MALVKERAFLYLKSSMNDKAYAETHRIGCISYFRTILVADQFICGTGWPCSLLAPIFRAGAVTSFLYESTGQSRLSKSNPVFGTWTLRHWSVRGGSELVGPPGLQNGEDHSRHLVSGCCQRLLMWETASYQTIDIWDMGESLSESFFMWTKVLCRSIFLAVSSPLLVMPQREADPPDSLCLGTIPK